MKQLDLFGFSVNEEISASELQKQRLNSYNENHCFQYDIRIKNYKEDLFYSGLTQDEVERMKVSDFDFGIAENDDEKQLCCAFIKRHEWLGTISQYTTHYFYAKYKGILGGVILMSVPNAFSKILGNETPNLERLISRGACISWSPKNLASHFLMWCIKWMVQNTDFRIFTAYSDPSAKELGSIYQACNFYYLGNKFGTTTRYINPFNNKICSDRFFRQRSAYKKYAKLLGIEWKREWDAGGRMNWDIIPNDIEQQLRDMSKSVQLKSQKIDYEPKHKYVYVLGRDKRETKQLRQMLERNVQTFSYPKERGK